ncbi:MAG: hypothetical protein SOW59_02600 [Corynebacterium sp.]|nr:hypothetical protein [Corynebacterium sp.]
MPPFNPTKLVRHHFLSVQGRNAALAVIVMAALGINCVGGAANASESVTNLAQGGYSPEEIAAALSTPFSVPAGQTTTFQLPVAASASYNDGAWSVATAGNSVTITAPSEGGTISVPVTAQGRSATITLVAEPAGNAQQVESTSNTGGQPATANDGNTVGGENPPAGTDDVQNGNQRSTSNLENAALPVVPGTTPERRPAAVVDEEQAETLYLESRIEGSTITVNLGMTEAMSFYNRFGNLDREQFTLRYVDANRNIIENVTRETDIASRQLTLTYPEGEAPDNPFIMQLVRNDGTGVAVQAVLEDPNYQSVAKGSGDVFDSTSSEAQTGRNNGTVAGITLIALIILGGVVVVGLVAAIVALVLRKRRPRRGQHHR